MNPHLEKALNELKEAGADGIPTHEEVLNAMDDSEWAGAISDHGDWTLIKESENSYRTNIRHHVE